MVVCSVAMLVTCSSCSARSSYLADVGDSCDTATSRATTDLAFARRDGFGGYDVNELPARVAVLDELLRSARALRAPAGEEHLLDEWLAGVQKVRDEEQEVYDAYRQLGPSAYFAAAMLLGVHDDAADSADRAARAVGVDQCARIGEWKVIRR